MLRPLATLVNRALRLYWRIRKPVTFGVRAIVLHRDGRLLLVKHTYDRYWYLPGGGRRRDEEPGAAIAREIEEEVGITALAIERKLGTYFSEREGKRDTIEVFVVRAEEFGRLQRLEIAACEWFRPDALPPNTSPATQRRVAEYLGRREIERAW
jgi:8-oxo-dGTP pyrophosphatase MutT (NUDIX family)